MPSLYEHQFDALQKMKNGCVLCGGVGTGKSITSLAYYICKVCDGSSTDGQKFIMPIRMKTLVIITTAKKRDSKEWDKEIERWGLSQDPEKSYRGTLVRIDSWNNIQKYRNMYGAFFIFDEQKLVGSGAWVKSFYKIAKKNEWIVLSATPGDVWKDYMAIFIANGFYKNKSDFCWQHILYDPFIKQYPKIKGYLNEPLLEKHRKEVLIIMSFDKPAIQHHEDLYVIYDAEKFNTVWYKHWNPWEDKPIQQASEWFSLARRAVNENPERVRAVEEICHSKPKVIIFYAFNYELELLRDMCKKNNFKCAEWNGQKHEEIPNTDSWVYIVNYTAAAEGWECITTNTIVFFSQIYSYRMMQQASGRIDRLNTPYTDLYYYHIISYAPVDKIISKALNRKEEFNEKAFLEELEVGENGHESFEDAWAAWEASNT